MICAVLSRSSIGTNWSANNMVQLHDDGANDKQKPFPTTALSAAVAAQTDSLLVLHKIPI